MREVNDWGGAGLRMVPSRVAEKVAKGQEPIPQGLKPTIILARLRHD
jgi:hypothetical protein